MVDFKRSQAAKARKKTHGNKSPNLVDRRGRAARPVTVGKPKTGKRLPGQKKGMGTAAAARRSSAAGRGHAPIQRPGSSKGYGSGGRR